MNVHQKYLETEFSITIRRPTGDKIAFENSDFSDAWSAFVDC